MHQYCTLYPEEYFKITLIKGELEGIERNKIRCYTYNQCGKVIKR